MRSNYSVLSGSFVFNRHVGLSSLNTSFLRFITILNFALLRYCSSAPVLYPKTLFLILLYRKGTEVEVLEKGNESFESWRPAKIVSGNGHTYVVVYESCSASPMNKVPRKALRPRPPLQTKCWAFADLAEVFDDDGSWKLAEVMGTRGSNNIVARLLNSSKEIVVVAPLFQLRVPHTCCGFADVSCSPCNRGRNPYFLRGSKLRSIWYTAHWLLGTAISIIGIINIYIGLHGCDKKTSKNLKIWTLFFTFQVVMIAFIYLIHK